MSKIDSLLHKISEALSQCQKSYWEDFESVSYEELSDRLHVTATRLDVVLHLNQSLVDKQLPETTTEDDETEEQSNPLLPDGVEMETRSIFRSLVKYATIPFAFLHLKDDEVFRPKQYKENLDKLQCYLGVWETAMECLILLVQFIGKNRENIKIPIDSISDCIIACALQCTQKSKWWDATKHRNYEVAIRLVQQLARSFQDNDSGNVDIDRVVTEYLAKMLPHIEGHLQKLLSSDLDQEHVLYTFVITWIVTTSMKQNLASKQHVLVFIKSLIKILDFAKSECKELAIETIRYVVLQCKAHDDAQEILASIHFSLADALLSVLHFRTKNIAGSALQVLVDVLCSLPPTPTLNVGGGKTVSFLKDRKSVEKLVDTIVYELEYIDNPEMLQVYVETLPPLFQRLGMELVKSFHSLLPRLITLLDIAVDSIVIGALKLLGVLILTCSERMAYHHKRVFAACVYVYMENLDRSNPDAQKAVWDALQDTLQKLKQIIPADTFKGLVDSLPKEPEMTQLIEFLR